jgi:hypothetical protein
MHSRDALEGGTQWHSVAIRGTLPHSGSEFRQAGEGSFVTQDPSFVKRAAHRRWGGQHSRHAPRRRRSMQHRRRVQRESFVKRERGDSASPTPTPTPTPTDGTAVGAAAICTGIAAPAVWVCSLWGNGLFGW